METSTKQIDPTELQRLAEDPSNAVYEYTYDETPGGLMAPDDADAALRRACLMFDAGARVSDTATDEYLRTKVLAQAPDVQAFQERYPKSFAMATQRIRPSGHSLDSLTRLRALLLVLIGVQRSTADEKTKAQYALLMTTRTFAKHVEGSATHITRVPDTQDVDPISTEELVAMAGGGTLPFVTQ